MLVPRRITPGRSSLTLEPINVYDLGLKLTRESEHGRSLLYLVHVSLFVLSLVHVFQLLLVTDNGNCISVWSHNLYSMGYNINQID